MRILVVEDDPVLSDGLKVGLGLYGATLDIVSSCADGQAALAADAFDALVLDLMLPDGSGLDLLTALRSRGDRTPVLLLTALDEVADRIRGLDAGADDYLTKPFDGDELLARIRALIRRSSGQASSLIGIGDVAIDTAARVVSHQGREIPLTAREYALVEYLATHRGQVVSRSELYEHLFDEDDDTLSNLLDVHVSNVRKKLGADFITTRRGHGYTIE